MTGWGWVMLGLAIALWAIFTNKDGKGRLITYPMVKYILRKQLEKTNKKTEEKSLTMKDVRRTLWVLQNVVSTPGLFRMWQIFVLLIIWYPVSWTLNWTGEPDPYILAYIALYADDLLTGGDDKWKKRWQSLKNKVRWQKFAPTPIRVPSA